MAASLAASASGAESGGLWCSGAYRVPTYHYHYLPPTETKSVAPQWEARGSSVLLAWSGRPRLCRVTLNVAWYILADLFKDGPRLSQQRELERQKRHLRRL